jgi:N-terminal C2 in EEIG1 and EHBP1 proteins
MLSKSSRPRLQVSLQIHELSLIPLVTGRVFVKWHILHSSRGECRGKTERAPIVDHKAAWPDYKRECTFKVSIGKGGVLNERMLIVEVWLEMISGRERLRMGNIAVNLCEYASVQKETRRYLLQESKMNSTIKVTLSVLHVEGSREYVTPPLKKAQMFHGITNLLADSKDLPQISRGIEQQNIKAILHSPTEDIYRRTFAAQWRVQAGELTPSDVVEDIFKGGSGWKFSRPSSPPNLSDRHFRRRADAMEIVRQDSHDRLTNHTHRPPQRIHRTNFQRPSTPISADEELSDEDDGLVMNGDTPTWPSRQHSRSSRLGHLRSASIVSVTPRQQYLSPHHRHMLTPGQWDKEELDSGKRSWAVPSLSTVEEKLEKRKLAKSPSTSQLGSAPGSSGRYSSTTSGNTSFIGNGDSHVHVVDEMSADDTESNSSF